MSADAIGKLPATGMSTSLLVAAHAMQGLIAGSVARNGVSALQDEDAQGELTELAMTLGDRLIETVEIARVREINEWRYARAERIERALRDLVAACDKGDVGQTDRLRVALSAATEQLADDEIPF